LASVPDIRQDKVASLRAEIQSGQFQRSNDQVAGAIVNEHLGSSNE
jgi:anti-sigma28 factor (negative regulator of flagellin synthesis)